MIAWLAPDDPFPPVERSLEQPNGLLAASAHVDADTLIRDLVDAADRPGELVVVTSDKPLYSYARTRGAQVLRAHDWNALARGAKPRASRAAAKSEKPERETDVEGWLKRFSRE